MVKNNKTNEVDSVKLVWRLFGIMGAICGVCMWFVISSNAGQDTKIDTMISRTQFTQLFAQAQTDNEREHDIILIGMTRLEKKVDDNTKKTSNVDSKLSKIIGMLSGEADNDRDSY